MRQWIKSKTTPQDFFQKDPMKYFVKWGYGTVRLQNVKAGDLVIYLDQDKDTNFVIKHVGVMMATGLIASNFSDRTQVTHHEIQQIPSHFGACVTFARKPSGYKEENK